MKIKASEIRKGNVILLNNQKYEVENISNITPGRRAAIVQISLFNIINFQKQEIRCSPEEDLIQINIYNKLHIFNYKNDKEFIFINSENYNQIAIPIDIIDEKKSKFLIPEQEIYLGLDEDDNFVNIVWPIKVTLKVKSAPPSQKNASSDDRKRVVLDNDETIVTPGYIKEGDEIIINLETFDFIGRK